MNPNREETLFALALEKPADKRPVFRDVICEGNLTTFDIEWSAEYKKGNMSLNPLLIASLLLLCALGESAYALDPNLPPGGNFDLHHWYLQLPTSGGVLTGTGGSVDSASTSQLVAGFTNAYFYTAGDGAMTFWVPDDGATTSGSSHPRSELREELSPGDTGVNWTLYGTHIMTGTCVVSNVPSDTMKVCIGQIHEPNNKPDGSSSANNEQMIMFDLSGSTKKIYANINLDGNLSSSFSVTLVSGSSVALGKPVNYTMSVVNGLLTIIVNNVTNSWNLFSGTNFSGHIAQNWDAASSNTVYFKAGDYNQTDDFCSCSTDGAKVAFYSLTLYHAPSITNQPASTNAIVGQNSTFKVAADGNGALDYQWQFNATNIISATNASLTVSNVSGASAGDYTVAISDSFGSVTSAVAVLTVILPPAISSSKMSTDRGSFTLTGTGSANQSYVLLTATNLIPPVTWQRAATNNADSNGMFNFIDPQITNYGQQFYRVSTP